jgi:hypothetical protein
METRSYEPALEFLAKLQATIGVWAVMGLRLQQRRKERLSARPGAGSGQKGIG